MGGSCPIIYNKPFAKSLLISFTRIKEFRDIFYKEPEKSLSKIFYSLCKNENELKKCIEDFNILVRDKRRLNFQQLLDFILTTLNEELNENIYKDREKNMKDYAEKFSEMTNSIIEKLFFRYILLYSQFIFF